MIQFRRLAALLLGLWLGGGFFADFAVTQNFQTVDRFLAAPGSVGTAVELHKVGRPRERVILRRNAGEENNYLFENWEWMQLLLGAMLMATLFFGERPQKTTLAAALLMWAIVAAQRFWLTPEVASLGRALADLPATDPLNKTFWMYHGFYSGAEIVKLLAGCGLAIRLSIRSKPNPDLFAKEYDAQQALAAKTAAGLKPQRTQLG